MFSRFSQLAALVVVTIATVVGAHSALADTVKASEWVGRVVVTTDGELLGRIEDFALDIDSKRIKYVVVSIGSFLIDDNLVAVHPDALGNSEDGQYLVVYTDTLDQAARFGADSWPASADVMASAARAPVAVEEVAAEDQANGFANDGVATISNGRRTATMKTGDSTALFETRVETKVDANVDAGPRVTVEVQPKRFRDASGGEPLLADSEFERLDDNGDGYLSRREIGARLNRDVRYSDYDIDGNDGIDAFEYQILKDHSRG